MANVSDAVLAIRRDVAFKNRGKPTTYHTFVSKTVNHKTGKYTPTFTDSSVDETLTGTLDQETIDKSGGKYKRDDMAFKYKTEDLPETPPNSQSQITYNSVTYQIVDYALSPDGNVYLIIGRKI